MPTAAELFKDGLLAEAVTAALAAVKDDPADKARRWQLAEMLIFAGDLERADKHLDAIISSGDPKEMMTVAALRQLVRAEMSRREVFEKGRAPEFLSPPDEAERHALEALLGLRENTIAAAAAATAALEESRPKPAGTADGISIADFRDLDDVTASVLEVLTPNGKYFWLPVSAVKSIEFYKPEARTDLYWRRAKLDVAGGPAGEAFIPCLYPGSYADADAGFKLGRKTDYRGGDGSPVRGVGLREFLVGDDVKSVMELGTLAFPAAG